LQDECSTIQSNEIAVCLRIVNKLKPYIPQKKHYSIRAQQLPFCFLCNDILRYIGYTKYTQTLSPTKSATGIDALKLNSTSLYSILSRDPNSLSIFDYDNYLIQSLEESRRSKDAVFNSILDMQAVTNTCHEYELEFAQHISLMPGLKMVRLLGTKKNPRNDPKKESSTTQSMINHPDVRKETEKPTSSLKEEIKTMEAEIQVLDSQLKDALKDNKNKVDYGKQIKELKAQWDRNNSSSNNQSILSNNRRLYEKNQCSQKIKK
jgi:hypothetical protein